MSSPTPSPRMAPPAGMASCVLAGLFCLALAYPGIADVTIHCLDIGQGDATLIVSSSGQTMLVDGGNNGMGNSVIVPYLASLGIGELDYMVATHYHADHIGGLDEVFQQVGVSENVYDRGWSYTTQTYNQYALAVATKRTTIIEDQVIHLGDGVTVTCLGLNGNGELSPPFDNSGYENEYCVTLLVECGDFDFFVAGDLIGTNLSGHKNIESSIAPEAGTIEVYRVNHHCSWTSSNTFFLSVIRPEVAIVSVGNNSYGHPHQEVLDRLISFGAFVYQTEVGTGGTLPPQDLRVVSDHVIIVTDGYGEYWVDGDQYVMDEPVPTTVPDLARFELLGNYPNPFNPATSIIFISPRPGPARLTVFDLAGRLVWRNGFTAGEGRQSLLWHGTDLTGVALPTGIYVYQLELPDRVGTGRMTLIK